jgi:hypothetical protein
MRRPVGARAFAAVSRVARPWVSAARGTTRRGVLFVVLAAAVLSPVIYGAVAGGLWMAAPYLEYAFEPERNARALAALEPVYGEAASCIECHAPQVERKASASHAGIACESCHGPLLVHAQSSPGPEAAEAIDEPTDKVCIRCHEFTTGRPEGFPQVRMDRHFIVECLACHDPHTGISRHPLAVLHPIRGLPGCVTCHGEEAFKARDMRHPITDEVDGECIKCHAVYRDYKDEWD